MSTWTAETCDREIVDNVGLQAGEARPCEKPAEGMAHDIEFGDWYPACRVHRDSTLTGLLSGRPELAEVGRGFLHALGVSAA